MLTCGWVEVSSRIKLQKIYLRNVQFCLPSTPLTNLAILLAETQSSFFTELHVTHLTKSINSLFYVHKGGFECSPSVSSTLGFHVLRELQSTGLQSWSELKVQTFFRWSLISTEGVFWSLNGGVCISQGCCVVGSSMTVSQVEQKFTSLFIHKLHLGLCESLMSFCIRYYKKKSSYDICMWCISSALAW